MDPDELITLRVQYLVDTDPLDCTSMYPIPTRAPTYAFASTMPLATQLGTILRLLGAPQRAINDQRSTGDCMAVHFRKMTGMRIGRAVVVLIGKLFPGSIVSN
uniref:FHOD1 N-terminal GTPase-binding domain-containing protein n=1 Tax=Glossina palpalis gambiensis TaxID=67801 RepID=A0A1B0ANQ6_9MUSC